MYWVEKTYRVGKKQILAWINLFDLREWGPTKAEDSAAHLNPACCFQQSPRRGLPAHWTPEQLVLGGI